MTINLKVGGIYVTSVPRCLVTIEFQDERGFHGVIAGPHGKVSGIWDETGRRDQSGDYSGAIYDIVAPANDAVPVDKPT